MFEDRINKTAIRWNKFENHCHAGNLFKYSLILQLIYIRYFESRDRRSSSDIPIGTDLKLILFRSAAVWIKILWVERFRKRGELERYGVKPGVNRNYVSDCPSYFKGFVCFYMHNADGARTVWLTTWFTCTQLTMIIFVTCFM